MDKKYLYTTAKSEIDMELIKAECHTLTNSYPNEDGIAISYKLVDVSRGAYVKKCIEIMFEVDNMDELLAKIQNARLYQEGFRVSVIKGSANCEFSSMEVCREVGALIDGKANLEQSTLTYYVVFLSLIHI